MCACHPPNLLTLEEVSVTFRKGSSEITPLKRIGISIDEQDFIAVMGPSGSGKSTLLSVLGCLITPSQGRVRFQGKDISAASDQELAAIRGEKIGFVFQNFFLVPYLDACQNVALPLHYLRREREQSAELARATLERVGLAHRVTHRPAELSGGEMQRVAIARALVCAPKIILADEPTGSLDSATGTTVLDLFDEIHAQGTALLIATHDPKVAERAKKVLRIKDGMVSRAS